MTVLKYFGLFTIALGAVLISREYEKNQRRRLFELAEFIRLSEHIKTKISCFLSPKADWLSDFSSPSSVISEFLAEASRLPSLEASFDKISDKLSLGKEKEVLKRLFNSLGKTYKDGEISLLEGAVSELSSEKRELSESCEKNIKTVKVLAAALSLGLIILLI